MSRSKFLSCIVENFRRQWGLDLITVTKCFWNVSEQMGVANEKRDLRFCCLGRILGTADRLQQL